MFIPTALAAGLLLPAKPNIVFVLADDLGYGELGSYGQTKIKTPILDQMAKEGIRFTDHYSGSPVCAPSRCTLLTGLHTGHAYVRDNYEMGGWGQNEPEGQLPLLANTETIARMLKRNGYVTGVFGKWGLGGPESNGHPNLQGFDEFFGILCQRVAHNHYPTHLWWNKSIFPLKNPYFSAHQKLIKEPANAKDYDRYQGMEFASDLITDRAIHFIRKNKGKPFFAYVPYPVPHAALQVPNDSLKEYENAFEETPYLGHKSYLPHRKPRAAYAAMVSRMDKHIGMILSELKKQRLDQNTIVFFSSDNGPTFNGGTDSAFFRSAGPLRDLKTSVYEGGIRVPLIAKFPGVIKPGRVSNHVSAFWDFAPTLAEISGSKWSVPTDGLSFWNELQGKPQKPHEALYWEFSSGGGKQAVRFGNYKAVRVQIMKNPSGEIQLFDLSADIGESNNIAKSHPELVAKAAKLMSQMRTPSPIRSWNFQKSER